MGEGGLLLKINLNLHEQFLSIYIYININIILGKLILGKIAIIFSWNRLQIWWKHNGSRTLHRKIWANNIAQIFMEVNVDKVENWKYP